MLMRTLRTGATEIQYNRFKEYRKKNNLTNCPLCTEKVLKKFRYWNLVRNRFPYDRVADRHHMLLPKRHVSENSLNNKEKMELKILRNKFMHDPKYTIIFETTLTLRTIPAHYHLHLMSFKPTHISLKVNKVL